MLRKTTLWILGLCLIVAIAGTNNAPTVAQENNTAATAYQLNMRTGPGTNYETITTLPPNTQVILEARNADTSWLLVHTQDGASRGWLASLYLAYPIGYSATTLPISTEIVSGPTIPAAPAAAPAAENQAPAAAPGGVTAYTSYEMNVRSGPGTNHNTLGKIPASTGLVLEARNGDASWVLAHTEDNSMRGWLASLYLRFTGTTASSLPHSDEILSAPAPAEPNANADYANADLGSYDVAGVTSIDLTAYPVVGRATGHAREIFLRGQQLGNNRHVLAKVGDCSSEHWYFLKSFAWGDYDLGGYSNLQAVVNHFGESLAYDSQATHNGFNVNAVGAPQWANPAYCSADESPLECEFRLHKPSVAVIMFGTSDLLVMTPQEFNFYMRQIVNESIEAGVIPILSTFPGNQGFWDRTILYNQIVVRIALDYDIPLINLWLALESLPNQGLEADGFHLSEPAYGTSCYLVDPYLSKGYPVRNLVTLQTLDAVWRGAMQ